MAFAWFGDLLDPSHIFGLSAPCEEDDENTRHDANAGTAGLAATAATTSLMRDADHGCIAAEKATTCPNCHILHAIGTSKDDGWQCNGLSGVCKSGITDFYQTKGMNRFRCDECDFDLCQTCHEDSQRLPLRTSSTLEPTVSFKSCMSTEAPARVSRKLPLCCCSPSTIFASLRWRWKKRKTPVTSAASMQPGPTNMTSDVSDVARRAIEDLHATKREARVSAESGLDWVEWSQPNVELFYKYDWYNGDLEVIGDVMLDLDPLRLWVILREYDLIPLWTRAISCTRLGRCDSLTSNSDVASEFYCVVSKAVLPFMYPSELHTERTRVDALEEHGFLLVIGVSPDPEATEHNGVAIPPVAIGNKLVVSRIMDAVTPKPNNRAVLTLRRSVKTGVPYLPSRAIGVAAGILVGGQITNLQNIYASWLDGTCTAYEERLTAGPEASSYAALRSRLEAVISQAS